MKEIWKPVEGFEGLYEVSNLGQVKSLERYIENNGGLQRRHEKILKQNTTSGHCTVILCKGGKTYPRLVHRLVATAFIPNPDNKPVVDHIDTNPLNNNMLNLRWVTAQENCLNPITRVNNSLSKQGHPYYGRPLTEEERMKISRAHVGKKHTEEHKKALSESHKNSQKARDTSVANLQKAREANIGRKASDETKEKIRQKLTGVHKGRSWKLVDGKRVWYDKGE
jgi:hypothetical protein